MLRCPELSRLPKGPVFGSINFRKQTPGAVAPLAQSNFFYAERLDPSHPAKGLPPNFFPKFRTQSFGISAYPIGLLGKPIHLWPEPLRCFFDTWDDRIERAQSERKLAPNGGEDLPKISQVILNNERPGSVSMSFLVATSKKRTSSKKVIRSAISRKLKTALTLIVARGAEVNEAKGRKKIVFNQENAKERDDWILRGWSYIFFPTIEIYRMPYHDLIPLLRVGLRRIQNFGRQLEERWEARIPRLKVKKEALSDLTSSSDVHPKQKNDALGLNSHLPGLNQTLYDRQHFRRQEAKPDSPRPMRIQSNNRPHHSPQIVTTEDSGRKHRPSNSIRADYMRNRPSRVPFSGTTEDKQDPANKARSPSTTPRDRLPVGKPRRDSHQHNPIRPLAEVIRDRSHRIPTNTKPKASSQPPNVTSPQVSNRRESGLPTRQKSGKLLGPKVVSCNDTEKLLDESFRKLSRKLLDAPPGSPDILVEVLREVIKKAKPLSPPTYFEVPAPKKRSKNWVSNQKRGSRFKNPAQDAEKDHDIRGQIQDSLKNRPSRPNPISRPPPPPKR